MSELPFQQLLKIIEYTSAPCGRSISNAPTICPACLSDGIEKAYCLGFKNGKVYEADKWSGLIVAKNTLSIINRLEAYRLSTEENKK